MSRPEHTAPPEIFYNDTEARKYTGNSRVVAIQAEMTERALELLNLDKAGMILDIGCGSGLSGQVLEEHGHMWCGLDVSESMLQVALERSEGGGDLILSDIGQGIGFRAGSFDGAISISVIQWLCNADKSDHVPRKRLMVYIQCFDE
jgi:18S rRNA (guanine1575-N7)-methyltransferase